MLDWNLIIQSHEDTAVEIDQNSDADSLMVMNSDSAAAIESLLFYLLVVYLWASYSGSLYLGFLTCNLREVMTLPHRIVMIKGAQVPLPFLSPVILPQSCEQGQCHYFKNGEPKAQRNEVSFPKVCGVQRPTEIFVGTSHYLLPPLQEEWPFHSHSAVKEPGVWRIVQSRMAGAQGKWQGGEGSEGGDAGRKAAAS